MPELYVIPHEEEVRRLLNKAFCEPRRIDLLCTVIPHGRAFSAPLLVEIDRWLFQLVCLERMEEQIDVRKPGHAAYFNQLHDLRGTVLGHLDYYLVRIDRIFRKPHQRHGLKAALIIIDTACKVCERAKKASGLRR